MIFHRRLLSCASHRGKSFRFSPLQHIGSRVGQKVNSEPHDNSTGSIGWYRKGVCFFFNISSWSVSTQSCRVGRVHRDGITRKVRVLVKYDRKCCSPPGVKLEPELPPLARASTRQDGNSLPVADRLLVPTWH